LIDAFAQGGPVVLGLDDTIERRRGKRTAAKGIWDCPVFDTAGECSSSGRLADEASEG
jgi:hypothetical protein